MKPSIDSKCHFSLLFGLYFLKAFESFRDLGKRTVHISKAKGTTRLWNKTNFHALRCLLSVAPNLEPQIQTLCIQRNENCFNLHLLLLITTKCQFDVFFLFFKTIQCHHLVILPRGSRIYVSKQVKQTNTINCSFLMTAKLKL